MKHIGKISIVLIVAALITAALVIQHQAELGLKKIAQDFQLSLKAFGTLEYKGLEVTVLKPSATFSGVTFKPLNKSGVVTADFIRIDNMTPMEVYRLVYHDEYPPSMTVSAQNMKVPFTQILADSEFIKNLALDDRSMDFKLGYEYSMKEGRVEIKNLDAEMQDVFKLKSEFKLSNVPKFSAQIFDELKTEQQQLEWQKKFLNSHLDHAVLKLDNSNLTDRTQAAFKKTYGLDLVSVFKVAQGLLGLLNINKGEKNLEYMVEFFEKPQAYTLTAQSKKPIALSALYDPKLWMELPNHYNLKVEKRD